MKAIIMNGINKMKEHAEEVPEDALEVIGILDDILIYVSDFTSPDVEDTEEGTLDEYYDSLEDMDEFEKEVAVKSAEEYHEREAIRKEAREGLAEMTEKQLEEEFDIKGIELKT